MADSNVDDAFTADLMARANAITPSFPIVHYDKDGDCIELLLSSHSYQARRIDDLITVYVTRSEEGGEVVGALIKGVKHFLRTLATQQPGTEIDFSGGNVFLEYILTAGLWLKSPDNDDDTIKFYLELRSAAKESGLAVELGDSVGA